MGIYYAKNTEIHRGFGWLAPWRFLFETGEERAVEHEDGVVVVPGEVAFKGRGVSPELEVVFKGAAAAHVRFENAERGRGGDFVEFGDGDQAVGGRRLKHTAPL